MRVVPLGALLIGVPPAFGFQLPPPSTVGTVAGRVIEAHSGDPAKAIPKVLVVLKHGQEPGTGTYSDEKGNFRLQVGPGAYTVAVERNGYVAASSRNRTITVQKGQTTEDVNLELTRTGAVSGRIVDADGEPRSSVSVQLRPVTEKKGAPFHGAVTDDRGAYRIFQIPPGKYHLSAAYQPASQQWGMKLQTADGKPEESYITTYFPATPDLTQAAAIDVPAGADLGGLDLQLQRAHAVRVRGRVSGLEVAPFPFVVITLQAAGSQSGTVRDALVRDPSGEFELHGVLPGKYVLSANAPDLTNRGSGPSTERAIEVGQTDLEGIQLTLAAPQAVGGVVIAPEGRRIPQGLLVMLSSRPKTNGREGGLAQVGSDGAFSLGSVAAGEYDVTLGSAGPADDLYVSAIRRGDEDALAKGLRVNGPSSEPVQIILKSNGGSVEVVVRTPKGEPVPEASIALLPDPPRRDHLALHCTCTSDARGICTLRGVAPGDYHAFAAPNEARLDFRDPDSIKTLEKQSKAVKVAEGERQSVEIEVAPDDQ